MKRPDLERERTTLFRVGDPGWRERLERDLAAVRPDCPELDATEAQSLDRLERAPGGALLKLGRVGHGKLTFLQTAYGPRRRPATTAELKAIFGEPIHAADAIRTLKRTDVLLTGRRTPVRRGRERRPACNTRTRGSRRTSSRSAGGGSDDPGSGDEGEPARGRQHRRTEALR